MNSSDGKIPPHSEGIERQVLATLIDQPRKAVAEFLSTVHNPGALFYDLRHRIVFGALCDLLDHGRPVTLLSLDQHLRDRGEIEDAGGTSYVAGIPGDATSFENLKDFIDQLLGLAVKRALIATSVEICRAGYDDPAEDALAKAEQLLLNIRADATATDDPTMKELILSAVDRFEDAARNKGKIRGLATGFYDLDQRLRGMRPGQLIVMAARPGCGKTSLAMNIAERVAVNDKLPVGVFTLEMSRDELISRMLSACSRVPLDLMDDGTLIEADQIKVTNASIKLGAAPLHICDEGGLTIAQLRAKARRMAMRHRIQLLIVDYLQLMNGSGRRRESNRTVEVTEISNGLKALAKELRLPIIALSQLNREVERECKREPRLSDLRDSGSIEQDADVVLFIHSSADDKETVIPVNLLIRKHRNGPTGNVPMTFYKRWTRFESTTEEVPR